MSSRTHVRRLLTKPIPRQVDHLWISEELLENVYNNFVRTRPCRRYVASVPGPLEARKRASKRRMVNVAPSFDPSNLITGVVFGPGYQKQSKDGLDEILEGRPQQHAPC